MGNNLSDSNNQRGAGLPDTNNSQNTNENQDQRAGDGNYKNIETSVNNRQAFGDDYEVEQEDQMSQGEAESERNERIGK